jgi:Na+/H+ antiporter NhaA
MALFIANLGLDESSLAAAKVGILVGSALAAVAGMLILAGVAGHPVGARGGSVDPP